MDKISLELQNKIKNIEEDGWWKSSSLETFLNRAQEMKNKGLKEDDIFLILEDLHCAVSNEFR